MSYRVLAALCCVPLLFGAGAEDFFQAIRNNQLAVLNKLATGKDAVAVKGERGVTPLLYAAAFGSPESVKVLLDAGADANAKNALGATPLLWGINSLEKVRLLIAHGADVNAATNLGKTPLLVAAQQDGSEAVVKMLLAKGANLDCRDKAMGFTPLVASTFANNTAVVRMLVNRGVDVNVADNAGFTPLMNAASAGNLELVQLLLAKGAKVNAVSGKEFEKTKNGALELGNFTALLLGSTYGPPALVRALLDAGADVQARDVRGMTPLMYAVTSESQNPEIVRMLLAAGADASAKSSRGETAIDWALKFRNRETLKALGIGAPASVSELVLTDAKTTDARASASKALAALQKSNPLFFANGGGCVACHHQGSAFLAVGLARDRGVVIDEKAAQEEVKTARSLWLGLSEGLLQRMDPPGGEDMLNAPLLGFAAMHAPADKVTDALIFNLAAMQKQNGSWIVSGFARSPSADSTISRTVMSLRALQLYGTPGRKAEFGDRVRRAGAWLQEAKPLYGDDYAMLLLGLKWTGADKAKIARFTSALLNQQRKNGGWASNANLPADAYATGQALYALHEGGGLNVKDPAYQRGLAFLKNTQELDGSWHVASRSPKFQPYFDSGFPHEHDQWISSLATGWAVRAMLLDVPPARQQASR
ncbi:MAG TPA: ankyrin repeat domain-containing protein [Bryobacteraceae bacterium]|nr:ankyrin repeat domain-containing protein [Bryobacteraceae bacterium]